MGHRIALQCLAVTAPEIRQREGSVAQKIAVWLLVLLIALSYRTNIQAEEITPTAIQYRFGKLPGSKTDECGMVLFISSYPSPETATVRYSMISWIDGWQSQYGPSYRSMGY